MSYKEMVMTSSSKLVDFIKVYNLVSSSHCKNLIEIIDSLSWYDHEWGDYNKVNPSLSPETEFQRASSNMISDLILRPTITKAIDMYIQQNSSETLYLQYQNHSKISFNRYKEGTKMLNHIDHIYSIFDGQIKGIPMLSVVGLLNTDFEGGEFKFWNEFKPNLTQGDILIFPSNFMFEHNVEMVTKGTRYSFVTWVY